MKDINICKSGIYYCDHGYNYSRPLKQVDDPYSSKAWSPKLISYISGDW